MLTNLAGNQNLTNLENYLDVSMLQNLKPTVVIKDNTYKGKSNIVDKFKNKEVEVDHNTFDSTSKITLGLMNLN